MTLRITNQVLLSRVGATKQRDRETEIERETGTKLYLHVVIFPNINNPLTK